MYCKRSLITLLYSKCSLNFRMIRTSMSFRGHPIKSWNANSGFRIPKFDGPIQRAGNDPLRFQRYASHCVLMTEQSLQIHSTVDWPYLAKVSEWAKLYQSRHWFQSAKKSEIFSLSSQTFCSRKIPTDFHVVLLSKMPVKNFQNLP